MIMGGGRRILGCRQEYLGPEKEGEEKKTDKKITDRNIRKKRKQ